MSETDPLLAAVEAPIIEHPCLFLEVHNDPAFRDFHDDGPTVLMEWLSDEAILHRGPRSWVCRTNATLNIAYGLGRLVSKEDTHG